MKLTNEKVEVRGYSGPQKEDRLHLNGRQFFGKINRAIHCKLSELQAVVEYADSIGAGQPGSYASLDHHFSDPASAYRDCQKVLEAHPKYKTVGDYLLHLARVDDPERSSGLEKLLLRPAHQKNLVKRRKKW